MNTHRQDLRDAFDYARAIGTREPTEADLDLFVELAGGDIWAISQARRDDIVFDILNPGNEEF